MKESERKHAELAIKEAAKCRPEDARVHPKVGVVVVKGNRVIAHTHRGDRSLVGNHAEFIALEHILQSESVVGATVYTTLEPCTTRNHPKVPCAARLAERKVSRVVIGMLDPNPEIHGNGFSRLREANISVDVFPAGLMAMVEDQNREFTRAQSSRSFDAEVTGEFIAANSARALDDWYRSLNVTYWSRNFYRDPTDLFTHLVEVTGGLSQLASEKKKPGVDPEAFIVKALAWWMAVCGKLGVRSVSELLWRKFPNACPYCAKPVHSPVACLKRKSERKGPDWALLQELGKIQSSKKPGSLGQWQRMFASIYPAGHTEMFGPSFARLMEELGEMAEAIRVFSAAPGYFLSEAADVFAWLMHIQNIMDLKKGLDENEMGTAIETRMCQAYPDYCWDCRENVCSCPPILPGTVGRIAHEVSGNLSDAFMQVDRALARFRPGQP